MLAVRHDVSVDLTGNPALRQAFIARPRGAGKVVAELARAAVHLEMQGPFLHHREAFRRSCGGAA